MRSTHFNIFDAHKAAEWMNGKFYRCMKVICLCLIVCIICIAWEMIFVGRLICHSENLVVGSRVHFFFFIFFSLHQRRLSYNIFHICEDEWEEWERPNERVGKNAKCTTNSHEFISAKITYIFPLGSMFIHTCFSIELNLL